MVREEVVEEDNMADMDMEGIIMVEGGEIEMDLGGEGR